MDKLEFTPFGFTTDMLENLFRDHLPNFLLENEFIEKFEVSEDGQFLSIHIGIRNGK